MGTDESQGISEVLSYILHGTVGGSQTLGDKAKMLASERDVRCDIEHVRDAQSLQHIHVSRITLVTCTPYGIRSRLRSKLLEA
jgi:hypothetical protein